MHRIILIRIEVLCAPDIILIGYQFGKLIEKKEMKNELKIHDDVAERWNESVAIKPNPIYSAFWMLIEAEIESMNRNGSMWNCEMLDSKNCSFLHYAVFHTEWRIKFVKYRSKFFFIDFSMETRNADGSIRNDTVTVRMLHIVCWVKLYKSDIWFWLFCNLSFYTKMRWYSIETR